MGFAFPQMGIGSPTPATAGEEPPGDPEALRRAARVLGGDAERGFSDTSKVLDVAVRDVTSADWSGRASATWASSAGWVGSDADSLASVVGAAAGVLAKLATEIQEAKDRASRARGRAEQNADALATAEGGLAKLAGQEDPDPQAKARLQGRAGEARTKRDAANGAVSDAAEDARRAARTAAKELTALTGRIPEPLPGLLAPVPVTPTPDPLALRFDGRSANPFANPFMGLGPGDVRRRQIEDEESRAAAEREKREGGMADRFGGEFEGLIGFRLFGNPNTEGYKRGRTIGTVASFFPTPASLAKLAVKQGGKRVLKMGARDGGEEAGERAGRKGAAGGRGRSGRPDNRTPEERRLDDIDDANAEILRQVGDGLGKAGVPQAGTASQVAALFLNKEFRRYVRIRSEVAIDRARRVPRKAKRNLAALRVAQELNRRPPDLSRGFPRDVPAEVRR